MLNRNTYDLIGFTSTDFAASDFSFTNGGAFNGTFQFNGGGNILQFTVSSVPEPGASGALTAIGLGILTIRRRRRQVRV